MLGFLLKRFLSSIVLVLFITFFTFAVMKIAGDPLADLRLNPAISKEMIAAEEKRMALDKPFHEQYLIWAGNILQGNLGLTQNKQKVVDVIKPALANTLLLNICAIFSSWFIALALGVLAAVFKDTWVDSSLRILTSVFMSVPGFVLAIFMLLFAVASAWFPVGGLRSVYYYELDFFGKVIDIARHLFLPVFIMTIGGLAGVQRQMRANLLDVFPQTYIQTARAKGVAEFWVVLKHAFRNAINPLVTIFGYEFSSLFAGSALVEMVLSFPGLGLLTLEAARKLDTNLVLANLLLGSIMLVLGNLLADILLTKVDPRIKIEA